MHVSSADLLGLNKGKEQQTTQDTFLYFSVAPHNVTLFSRAPEHVGWKMQKVKMLYVCHDCAVLLLGVMFSSLEIKNVHSHKTGDDIWVAFLFQT